MTVSRETLEFLEECIHRFHVGSRMYNIVIPMYWELRRKLADIEEKEEKALYAIN